MDEDLLFEQQLGFLVAYMGIPSHLLEALDGHVRDCVDLSAKSSLREPLVSCWLDAAFAYGLIERNGSTGFSLTPQGREYITSLPARHFAINALFSAAVVDTFLRSGALEFHGALAVLVRQLGESRFRGRFESEVLPLLLPRCNRPSETRVLEIGCGSGWALRAFGAALPALHGVGIDRDEARIGDARTSTDADGRLRFEVADIFGFESDERFDLILLHRALHHLWGERASLLLKLRSILRPGGCITIWEPAWPEDRQTLRESGFRELAFQNITEQLQGARFLSEAEILGWLSKGGVTITAHSIPPTDLLIIAS